MEIDISMEVEILIMKINISITEIEISVMGIDISIIEIEVPIMETELSIMKTDISIIEKVRCFDFENGNRNLDKENITFYSRNRNFGCASRHLGKWIF